MRRLNLIGLLLAASLGSAAAQEMKLPQISRTHADWDSVATELTSLDGFKDTLDLNRSAAAIFPDIGASPVPVLLPFDTASFLRDLANDVPLKPDYFSGFHAPSFFLSGPSGYDAVFSTYSRDIPVLGVSFSERIDIHLSGAGLLYELDEPVGLLAWPTNGLETDVPGLKRMFFENYVRYAFVRYGVPYVVAIECFDGGSRYRKISCRDADKVAARFLKALRVAGGTPQQQPDTVAPKTIDRPQAQSTVFTYYAPGDILPGTGVKGNRGRADHTVYSRIGFPLADAPAFANSQAFMNYGSCDSTGHSAAGTVGGIAAYRCRVNNNQTLVWNEAAADNYSYPWRDNFCEHRYFYVGQCPGGLGHQGQDIRPANCKHGDNANRCEAYQHDVVAVRDGMVMRFPGQMAAYVVVNAPDERVRGRYLHMFPKFMDQDGLLNGRRVAEGEVIGKVGNFEFRERATTYHLHFDLQVPTRYGWVFVNPYMTLVAAFERQIRGRGREIREDAVNSSIELAAPATVPAAETAPPAADPSAAAAETTGTAANPDQKDVDSEPNKRFGPETAQHDPTKPTYP